MKKYDLAASFLKHSGGPPLQVLYPSAGPEKVASQIESLWRHYIVSEDDAAIRGARLTLSEMDDSFISVCALEIGREPREGLAPRFNAACKGTITVYSRASTLVRGDEFEIATPRDTRQLIRAFDMLAGKQERLQRLMTQKMP
jgi:hypothetical protein